MKRAPKIPRQSVVGIEISDTAMRFVVLVPHAQAGHIVGTWGEQSIAFDAVEDDEIIEFSQAAAAARKLCEKTGVRRVSFSSLEDTRRDARFREVLQVGGFREVITMSTTESLDALTRDQSGQSLPILYFELPDELVLMRAGQEINRYPYPLGVYAIEELREYIENLDTELYRVLGHFGKTSSEILQELAEYRIPAHAANTWRNVSDLSLYIPPILYEESFAQSICIANAFAMCVGEYDESHIPQITAATFSSDTTVASNSASAFGRWFETGQGIIHPSVQESTTPDKAADTAADTTVEEKTEDTPQESPKESDTHTPSNSS